MWTYNDIYRAIINYINHKFRNSEYILNFGVICISTQQPTAVVKFCLRNVQSNRQHRWKTVIDRETSQELEASVRQTVQTQMPRFN